MEKGLLRCAKHGADPLGSRNRGRRTPAPGAGVGGLLGGALGPLGVAASFLALGLASGFLGGDLLGSLHQLLGNGVAQQELHGLDERSLRLDLLNLLAVAGQGLQSLNLVSPLGEVALGLGQGNLVVVNIPDSGGGELLHAPGVGHFGAGVDSPDTDRVGDDFFSDGANVQLDAVHGADQLQHGGEGVVQGGLVTDGGGVVAHMGVAVLADGIGGQTEGEDGAFPLASVGDADGGAVYTGVLEIAVVGQSLGDDGDGGVVSHIISSFRDFVPIIFVCGCTAVKT